MMRRNHTKKFLSFALLAALSLSLTSLPAYAQSGTDRLIGKTAPDFALNDLSGKTVKLSEFKGKPVLLEFWATWCPDCREVFPGMEKIYKEYSSQGLSVVMVSVDTKQDAVAPFMEKNGYTVPVLLDDGNMRKLYSVQRIPTAFLIDRKGVIKMYFVEYGEKGQPRLDAEIKKIVGK
ncbi:MAG: TlpA family protein disulfide reductase [Candidatus Latescibacterota bacterium]